MNRIALDAEPSMEPDQVVDDDFIRRAIDQAHLNALWLALYQSTGDLDLGRIRSRLATVGGRGLVDYVLSADDEAIVKAKAFEYLRRRKPSDPLPPPPSKAEARRLLEMYSQPLSDDEFEFAYEELALEDWPREATWTNGRPDDKLSEFKVIVIGAGISGLMAAIQLQRLGVPFTVIERQSGIGGTWLLNTYPEVRVDTSSYLYQYKFEKNYPWSEYFPTGEETRAYLEYIAKKYDVAHKFQFHREVVSADWDEDTARWRMMIKRSDGVEEVAEANLLVSASGLFSKPKLPDIPGIEQFEGTMFHTAQWDHSFDVKAKRVALIGTGSTGTQLAPGVAQSAQHLTVFQRTPNWINEAKNYRTPISQEVRWLFNTMPYYWNWYSYAVYFTATQMQYVQTYDPDWQARGGLVNEKNDKMREMLAGYIRSQVNDDPELVKKLTPEYPPMSRRMVIDNGFYRMLTWHNVDLVTDSIERITPKGIVTEDGTEYAFDLIILGSGFEVQRYFWPVNYKGRDGITLDDLWVKDGVRSYLGMALPGFPNFLIFYGPNGQPRSGGFYSWAEIWARYVGKAVVQMVEQDIRSMEVKQDVFERYNAALDEEMKKMVWTGEGSSYYVNEHGRVSLNVPWLTYEYHAMVREPNLDDFVVEKAD